MKHSHVSKPDGTCATCGYRKDDHGDAAQCESCPTIGPCEVVYANNTKLLLCWPCQDKHIQSVIDRVESNRVPNVKNDEIRYNGDFYNARVQSLISLRDSILADESIPTADREYAYQQALAKRLIELQRVMFEADEAKYKATLEQTIINRTLRDLGDSVRVDIREEIRKNDLQYQPQAPKIVAKPKLPKKSPMEKLIETLAMARGISYTEAKLMIEKGMK